LILINNIITFFINVRSNNQEWKMFYSGRFQQC